MKKLLTNNSLMTTLSCLIAVVGFIAGWTNRDFVWLARAGAILVGIGIVVLARTFISGTELHQSIFDPETKLSVFNREHYHRMGEAVPEFVLEQERNLFALGRLGPIISFTGTVIWGFGDLLNRVFGFCR